MCNNEELEQNENENMGGVVVDEVPEPIMIERYYGFVNGGEGYIKDRLTGQDIINFNFRLANSKLARRVYQACLNELNKPDE